MGHTKWNMCTYPKARSWTDPPRPQSRLRFPSWEYEDCNSLGRGADAKGVRQHSDHDWDNACKTRELCGITGPVGRARGHFRKGETWNRDNDVTRFCRDYGKEDKPCITQRMHRNNPHMEHEIVRNGHLEEAGYYTNCENANRVGYKKSHGGSKDGRYLDANFGASKNQVCWGTWRKSNNYDDYRKGTDGDMDSPNLGMVYKKDDDWQVDTSRMGGKYCRKEEGQYMVHGDFPMNLRGCETLESHTANGSNACIAQEDLVSWSFGYRDNSHRLEPWYDRPRLWDVVTESVAVQSRVLRPQVSTDGCPRTRRGRSDWSLDWEEDVGWAGGGTEAWQRNSCYRRTAPSALRHHIKKKQGR